MTGRERVRTICEGGIPDRIGYEDAFWPETTRRWRKEGLPPEVDPCEYFDIDTVCLPGPNQSFMLPTRILEETDQYKVWVDGNGVKRKDFKVGYGWIPYWDEYTLKSAKDWYELKERLKPSPERVPEGGPTPSRIGTRYRYLGIHEPFETSVFKAGHEQILMWMAEDPALIRDIFATLTELIIDMHGLMKGKGTEWDAVGWAGDMSFNKGPMFSPAMYRELVLPYHKRLCDYFHSQGLPSFLHSDGNLKPFLPLLVEAGFDALHPLEVKAGIDIREVKRDWGDKLVLVGNIDVRVMAGSKDEIEKEIREKLTVAKQGGRYMYHSDHSVPPDVSFENYLFVKEMVMKYGSYVN